MFGNLCEKILKIIIRFQAIGFRCFCNAIDYSAGFCPCDRTDHHPVLLPDAKSPDRLLGGIIVHGNLSVIEEHFQVSFLVDRVLEVFSGLAFLWHLREIFQLLFLPIDACIIVSARYASLPFCFAFGRVLTASSYRCLAWSLFQFSNKDHYSRSIIIPVVSLHVA